ncbi:MAG: hypothetical protein EOO09_21960 [Chitinophagaceae bacterium]|nr:MAG: hypothetical protein EOO09_21960 [Chitinophagaceae bacterium]
MKNILLGVMLLLAMASFAQPDTAKWVRAFPVTDYMVDISDSIRLVQVELPEGTSFKEKQLGLLKGIYRDAQQDTGTIGYGRCHLIKGHYYYFTINHKQSGRKPKAEDLLYTMMDSKPVYNGAITKLASHFIGLQEVGGSALYDRYQVFLAWTKTDENNVIDSIVSDINYTGSYFLQSDAAMNQQIKSGRFAGKGVLDVMMATGKDEVFKFLEYMAIKPNLYAGHEWKVAEIFATWLVSGAPAVIKE